MTRPSARLVAGQVAARLTAVANATGYYGQIGRPLPGQSLVAQGGTIPPTPQPKSSTDQRVRPYFVAYPGALGDGPDTDLALCAIDGVLPFSITAAGGDVDDVLALIDRIEAALHRWIPTVSGLVCGPVEHPLGYTGAGVLVDRDISPHRLYAVLPYRLTVTT